MNNLDHRPRRSARCTFKTFWAGFTDWYAERCTPEGAARERNKPKSNRGLQTMLLVGLLVGMPAIAALIGPLAAGTMSAVGTRAVAAGTQVLSVIIGLGFFIGLPAWAGYRTYQFCCAMCERGQDILDGRRARVRLL
jgi:hypothetical protein